MEKPKEHKTKKKYVSPKDEDVTIAPSPVPKQDRVETNPVKNYATISTQCGIEISDMPIDTKVTEKLEAIYDLIPHISSVIEKSEKNLEKAFKNALKSPKIIQDRGVSPIKDIPVPEDQKEVSFSPRTPPNTHPDIGDLLLNIQNIKDSRNLLSGFQKELLQLKKDIEECKRCKSVEENVECENDEQNYCEKHAIYVPLLRIGERGSKGAQIKLFNALKTEVFLKKELENQVQHILHLERKLSKAKKMKDAAKIKVLEKELKLAKSYFDNLMIKQQNERVLSEQQKIMKDKTEHECVNIEDCDKCCLERQIHDLLEKVRENIAKDIEDSKKRLKIQKMPNIDIRKPLQLQNILKMDIPPSLPPQISARSNFVFEAVVKDNETDDEEAINTKILVNKSTSVQVSSYKETNKPTTSDYVTNFARISTSPRRYSKSTKKIKTPSELGFRSNAGTQCDSNTSLLEHQEKAPTRKMTAQTQTAIGHDDSLYLFGFKEYLMKETCSSPVKQVDVMLQVSLEGSIDSIMHSVGVDTQLNDGLPKVKSSDIQGVILVEPRSEDLEMKQSQDSRIPSLMNEESSIESQDMPTNLHKNPSLKKMLLPPSTYPESQHAELETSIQNPYAEPKYRMRRYSISRPGESEIDMKQKSGDIFYKSLTEKEELPDRKATGWADSHSNITSELPSRVMLDSHGNYSSLLRKEASKSDNKIRHEEPSAKTQNTKKPSTEKKLSVQNGPEYTTDPNISKKISVILTETPETPSDDITLSLLNNNPNLDLIENGAKKAIADNQTEEVFADSQNPRSSAIEKEPSVDNLPETEFIPDDDNQIEDAFADSQYPRSRSIEKKPSVEKKPESELIPDDDNQTEEAFADSQYHRSHSIEKKPSVENKPESELIPDDDNQTEEAFADSQHPRSRSIEKEPSVENKPEKELITDYDNQTEEAFADIQNPRSSTIEKEPSETELISDENTPKQLNQNESAEADEQILSVAPNSGRSSILKKTSIDNKPESKNVPAEVDSENWTVLQNQPTNDEDRNSEQFADSQKAKKSITLKSNIGNQPERNRIAEENELIRSVSDEKLFRYIPDENKFDDHLANVIKPFETPKKKRDPVDKLYRYVPDENISDDRIEPPSRELIRRRSVPTNAFEYMEDLEISMSDPEAVPKEPFNDETYLTMLDDLQEHQTGSQESKVKEETETKDNQNGPSDNTVDAKNDSDIDDELTLLAIEAGSGFLEGISTTPFKKQMLDEKAKAADKTVLPMFPPTYKLIVNKNDLQNKSSDKKLLLGLSDAGRRKSMKLIEPPVHSIEKAGGMKMIIREEPGRRNKELTKKIADLYDTEKFVITNSPYSNKRDITIETNYILPEPNDRNLDYKPCTSKFRSEVPKITQERLEYSRKCSNLNKSVDSSTVSSEGEVLCNCKDISTGEVHSCPKGKIDIGKDQGGINYKENLSSHLFLEKERKHYNHWVTYYSTKKYKNESSSSSSQSDSVHDN